MIAILDYGSGNLRSAERAFAESGAEVVVTSDKKVAEKASALVVPGVGAFGACINQLRNINGEEIIADTIASGKKIFGICVGMQILFQESTEKGKHSGLGIINGSIDLLDAPVLPHIGWNTVDGGEGISFFSGIENEFFYFVHSYGVPTVTHKDGIVTSTYGSTFIAAIEYENIFATQFHPEKSGSAGLRLISNWIKTL